MSKNRDSGSSGRRRNFSILGVSFAVAMAFFLVIGMIAVAIPEFMSNDDEPAQVDFADFENDGNGEEERLRERLEEDPEDSSAMVQLADLLANTGRLDEAIRWYERAVDERPDDVELRVAFGQVLERRGYDLDAEVQLDRALELDEENVEAMFLLAEIKERKDPPRHDEAVELYERIIETAPESFYAQMSEERLAEGEAADDSDNVDDDGE